jgi:peptide/nickel transport system substrate-binding protein
LVVLTETAPVSIDPRFVSGAYDFKLSRLVYAPLVSVDNDTLEPKMELAESVLPSSPTEWDVTLKEAQFSDGRSVTADDVIYTVEAMRDPKILSVLKQRFIDDGLVEIHALDDHHLRFVLSHPHAPFITDLDFGILARPRGEAQKAALPAVPIGAGPFILDSRVGETWRFVANPRYFRGVPRASRLTVRTIRDDNSRLLALVGGSGDLTQNTISPLLIDAVAAQPRLKVETGRSSVYTYLGLNCDDPILKDSRVRRAIAYAIDRSLIVHTKLQDRALIATGMLPTFHWAYAGPPKVTDYPYDPARAKQLLDEAGYRDPDGDGPRPRFSLTYKTSSNKFRVAVARVIISMLADVGIEVELRPYEFGTFFADVKKGNFQLFMMQVPEIAEPDLYTRFFATKFIPTRENLDEGHNRVRYRNPALDRLLEAGRRELDREKRKAIYSEVQAILARDVPVVSLWHEDNVAAMRREVEGFRIVPTAQLSSLAVTGKTR